MGVGGIGAIGFQPYIYNTNGIGPSSLQPISPIGTDVVKAPSTDYSELLEENENVNPLKRGETKNFADILASQMAMSRLHAERVLPDAI
ncbi:MAG: hypothetical protein IJ747_03010 [Lachnospiraceae bacterium]|nr:hypothetical protein [Lachnospiraceae bacterium]